MIDKAPDSPGDEWPEDFYKKPADSPDHAALEELTEAACIEPVTDAHDEETEELRHIARRDIVRALSHHVVELEVENGTEQHPYSPDLDEFQALARELMTRHEITMEEVLKIAVLAGRRLPDVPEDWDPQWN